MRVVVQRVSKSTVTVEGHVVAAIGPGLLALVGVTHSDTLADVDVVAAKLLGLRIFRDESEKMNLTVHETGGEVLVVSQFTLYGDARKGRRPSFTDAAPPELAEPLVEQLLERLSVAGVGTASGRFGAMMDVEIHNDGPVTIVLETQLGRFI